MKCGYGGYETPPSRHFSTRNTQPATETRNAQPTKRFPYPRKVPGSVSRSYGLKAYMTSTTIYFSKLMNFHF